MSIERLIAKVLFDLYLDIGFEWDSLTYHEQKVLRSEENFKKVIEWMKAHEGDSVG
jgi:hypothetical protein